MNILTFISQCCDANGYLYLGQKCAEEGICYDSLRPMGAVLWFSIPYRLGLPPESLILGHGILLTISIVLSVLVARRFYQQQRSSLPDVFITLVFFLSSTVVHVIFLYPMLRTSLSDTPASLLALIATWLLFISPTHTAQRVLTLALSGIALGLAAWIRVFYLYPALLMLVVVIAVCFYKRRHIAELGLLLALISIVIQCINTKQQSGHWSYLDSKESKKWANTHLYSTNTGYDTIITDSNVYYAPCNHAPSLPDALKIRDFKSIACVIGGRIYFYLGSYSAHAYLSPFEHNLPPINVTNFNLLSKEGKLPLATKINFRERIGETIRLPAENGEVVILKANKIWKPDIHKKGEFLQTIYLERGSRYQIKMSLWSAQNPQSINIRVLNHETHNEVAGTEVHLLPILVAANEANNTMTETAIDKSGLYDIILSSEVYDKNTVLGKAAAERKLSINTDAFYAWDAQLIRIGHVNYSERTWATWIFVFNSLAVIGNILFIKGCVLKKEVSQLIAAALPMVCFVAALAITPEQRFVIFPVISFWMGSVIWIALIVSSRCAVKRD